MPEQNEPDSGETKTYQSIAVYDGSNPAYFKNWHAKVLSHYATWLNGEERARAKNELWELVTRGDHDDTSRSESGSILAQFVGQAAPEDAAPRTMSALTARATPPPPQQQLLERAKPFAQAAQRINSLFG